MRSQKNLVALLVFLTLLPFVVLCFYSHPAFDDFSDAVQRRQTGFWATQLDWYRHLTGRLFTSVLLTEASPLVHGGLGRYWLAPLGTLLLLGGSLYALMVVLMQQAWAAPARLLAAAGLLALWLVQNPSVAESVYWFNGLAVYTIPLALLIFWLAVVVRWWPVGDGALRLGLLLLNVGLGTCVLWSNEIVALPLLAVVAGLSAWEWWRRRPRRRARRWQLLGLLGWFTLALAVSLLAPGNLARAGLIGVAVPWYRVVLGPLVASAYLLLNWLSSGVLLYASALLLPTLARLAVAGPLPPNLALLARLRPAQLLGGGAALLLLLPLSAVPSYWATGGMMPPRARASLYLLFLLAWFALLLVAIVRARSRGWLQRLARAGTWPRPATALLWAGLFVNLATDHNQRVAHRDVGRASNTAVVAYYDWLSGRAGRYDAMLTARYDTLRTTSAQRVRVPALSADARPPSLFYYDITTDSTFGVNRAYGCYFGRQTVWTGEGGQGPPPKFYQPPAEDE